jgi:phosphate transport system permease protein
MAFLVILGLIALFLSVKGIHILREEKFDFISGSKWEVKTEDSGMIAELAFGMGAILVGTLLCSLMTIAIGLPIAVLSAHYLTFYAKGLVQIALISLNELVATFPSLLYGFWGFLIFLSSAEYWARLLKKYFWFIPTCHLASSRRS